MVCAPFLRVLHHTEPKSVGTRVLLSQRSGATGIACELRRDGVLRSSAIRLSAKCTPHRLSQRVLRNGSHSAPFRGSAIVPTILSFLSRALKGSSHSHAAHPPNE